MGQYYVIVNLDKQEFLNTYSFNDGAKLLEFGCSSEGTMTALAVLLSDGNGRGGGDLHSEHPLIGSWAGDRIVISGDYADKEKFLQKDEIVKFMMIGEERADEKPNLYVYAKKFFKDISEKVLEVILEDPYIYETYEKADLYGDAQKVFNNVKKKKAKKVA
ncbi:MAG: hypothetical protein HQ534_04450 [Armatimonadetes bacterium]|nr:hypothetical protein [Armatimonadota bacterium]